MSLARTPELEALAAECSRTEVTLSAVPPDRWDDPGLGSWTLAHLAGHLVGGVARITEYLDQPVSGEPVADRVSYFRYDAAATSPGVAQRAVQRAEAIGNDGLAAAFSDQWRASLERAATLDPSHLIATFQGPMRLDEYLATRVLEVVIHHMDVRAALDLPPDSDPGAARLTMQILEGLLGSARPRNMGRTRFLQAATGRLAVDDPRFPVLS